MGWRKGLLTASAVMMALLATPPTNAAIRRCLPSILSTVTSDASEQAAKKRAIANWTEKAERQGARAPSWHAAVARHLKCVRAASGTYECVAVASPCTIVQAPNRRPRRPAQDI